MTISADPYEYYEGCKDGQNCKEGKRCISANQCTNCTFGRCIQLAKETNSEGFSYSNTELSGTFQDGTHGSSQCKLCTNEQLATLVTEKNWVVYKRAGISMGDMDF